MKEYGSVIATIGCASISLFAAAVYFEKTKESIVRLETQFEAEKKLLLESFSNEKKLLLAKLSESDAVYEAEKKLFKEKLRAAIAEAELRTSEKFLMFGYSKEYHAFQEKVKADDSKLQKSG